MELLSVGETLGYLIVGIFFNTFLYGIVTYQYIVYFNTNFGDHYALRLMTCFVFLLDSAYSVGLIYSAWFYAVANYTNPSALLESTWAYGITSLATEGCAIITQGFLTWRIYRLSQSRVLALVGILLSIVALALGTGISLKKLIIGYIPDFINFEWLVVAWCISNVVADSYITATLITILIKSRNKLLKSPPRYRIAINRLIRWTIQTGVPADIFAILALISYVLWPESNMYGMWGIPIGRLYSITLLDTFLNRPAIDRSGSAKTEETESTLTQRTSEQQIDLEMQGGQLTTIVGLTNMSGESDEFY
ncbi:hypothetical protein CONPUDRAFT_169855 [Coniophora puteana RWD-64-598 SS2]|uniref:DUF6534 domain-containing protein n=1 Tax=Coniophora puteana (strain RWD-64-598) TaxID=741705 RepID=A0A5M3M871_CONPW|nr:uncharacterized protein CONPUDRAFT_169855 [Coniophora puteana RWD-64-598 SS2]EIW74990.1 hypothetical protein CONPUDRAFT_169855 [Coniophora puteana RWD-64-598 SS2]